MLNVAQRKFDFKLEYLALKTSVLPRFFRKLFIKEKRPTRNIGGPSWFNRLQVL